MEQFGANIKISPHVISHIKLCEISMGRGKPASQHIISTNTNGIVIRDYDMNLINSAGLGGIDSITINQDHLIVGRTAECEAFAYDFNPSTGELTRRYLTGVMKQSQRTPSVAHGADNGYFYASGSGQNPSIYKISTDTGNIAATWGDALTLQSEPYNDDFGNSNAVIATYLDRLMNLHLYCLMTTNQGDVWLQRHDPDDLSVVWRLITGLSVPATNSSDLTVSVTPEGTIIVNSELRVQAYDQQTKLLDFTPTGNRTTALGIHESGDYYVGDTSGIVHKYEKRSTNLIYSLTASTDIEILATDGEGILFLVDGNNRLKLYEESMDGTPPTLLSEASNSNSTGFWKSGTIHPGEQSVLY